MSSVAPARPGAARASVLDAEAAARLAGTEYQRFADLLRSLTREDWARPTECPAWDVRAMAGHVLGMARMVTSVPAFVRQNAGAARAGGGIDALTALQVREQRGLSCAELVEQVAVMGPAAVRGRRRLSRVLSRLPLPEKQVVGDAREWWSFGYLFDVVLTRDTWMHRVDICRATGRDLVLTPEHDGVLVSGVVAEWAQRHGAAYRLRLAGPAGGVWSAGEGGPELALDAAEFCRILSGRAEGAGLLAQQVPF
jgi:uncharacterized protein (TIGR03083 family)